MKFAQEDDALSSQKTVEKRRRDKFEDQCNMRTELGQQNRAEQILATGFLTTPS